jgi:HCOMODA/2-hydroxy-3-carboxy-muconic semialdehyde decarboxylase
MASAVNKAREDIALGNRILANEGVLDAFGHVSVRHPDNPGRYLLSRARSPELVEPADVLEYDLDSNPVKKTGQALYSERVIHGEIYKARPDVMAIAHHHSPAMMPFCVSGVELVPVFHLGAPMGNEVPFWDQRDDFGDTNMLVVKPEEGASLARALGGNSIVLMRRHGTTVVGNSVPDLLLRTIYSCRNAEFQWQARMLGNLSTLSPGEIEKCRTIHQQPNVSGRTWEYWSMRLEKSGNGLKRAKAARASAAKKLAVTKSKPSRKKMAKNGAKNAAKNAAKKAAKKAKGRKI